MFAAVSEEAGRKRTASEIDREDENDQAAVRRRISRACDQCNQLRSKCDGKHPCAHCLENGLSCAYERIHKKRGRAPKRDHSQTEENRPAGEQNEADTGNGAIIQHGRLQPNDPAPATNPPVPTGFSSSGLQPEVQYTTPEQSAFFNGFSMSQNPMMDTSSGTASLNREFAQANVMGLGMASSSIYGPGGIEMQGYGFPLGDDCSIAFMGRAPMVESPDWLALTTPLFTGDQRPTPPRPPDTIRYPVLLPLLPHLQSVIPQDLACDLLEQYFASSTSACLWPRNPYVLGYIFRKVSVLHPTEPRPCSSALLASMLWISAQHSDAPFLTAQPDVRAQTCQKLLELTMTMIKPLVHAYGPAATNQLARGSVGSLDAAVSGLFGPSDIASGRCTSKMQIDNIATYIHLATVVSASERKAASLRWWNSAWSLARELRLGRELPGDTATSVEAPRQVPANGLSETNSVSAGTQVSTHSKASLPTANQEDREERRRTWWLLFAMDRHLALCYNRPMFFLNKECEGLLQPMDDVDWQAGRFESVAAGAGRKGLDIECTSISVFGYFLPLMVILGEILDLNHARNRPRFGPGATRARDFSDTVDEIEQQLAAFERSLHRLDERYSRNGSSSGFDGVRGPYHRSELALQTQTIIAYSTHIMHVLHILLTGKWDPVALLDDNDLWISSQSFVNATEHAVSAAQALADIIEYDPDLSCMPFFFGIYLLQGSFLLLLFADKLQGGITSEVVKACETIVRAHEACVSTLDTQYQRNFRRVMRSALQQLRGRTHEDATEQQNWRREILKLYRWTGDGTGLAL